MQKARNRILIGALLLLIGLVAALVAPIRGLAAGWLVPVAYVLGAAAAWHLYASLLGYAQLKTQQTTAALTQFAEQLQQFKAAQAAADRPAEGTNP